MSFCENCSSVTGRRLRCKRPLTFFLTPLSRRERATTGRAADEWASPSQPKDAEASISPAIPCTRLANLILPPKQEAQHVAAHIPRWGCLGCSALVGGQGMGDVPRERKTLCFLYCWPVPFHIFMQIGASVRGRCTRPKGTGDRSGVRVSKAGPELGRSRASP